MEITWLDLHHRDLTVQQLYALLALRCEVFVVEQMCPYLDVDGQDLMAENRHLLGMRGDELVAYARILSPLDEISPVKIGRVIVSDQARRINLGNRLMEQVLASCKKQWPDSPLFLSAQAHLQKFYGRHGFLPVSEEYLEDDIPHIDMQK